MVFLGLSVANSFAALTPNISCYDDLLSGEAFGAWTADFMHSTAAIAEGSQALSAPLFDPGFEEFLDDLPGPDGVEGETGGASQQIDPVDLADAQSGMKKQRARRRSTNDASAPAGESTNKAVASPADNSINKCFKCSYKGCSFSCSKKYNLNRHAFVHISEKPYPCKYPGCSYSARRKPQLLIHECIHTGKKPYVCTYSKCSYSSARKADLVKHQRVHSEKRPYICIKPECGKLFVRDGDLRRHELIHTGEKPYICKYQGCASRFAERYLLVRHECTHVGAKPSRCSFCGKTFTYSSNRRRHERNIHPEAVVESLDDEEAED
jgi:hypothetical protein